MLIKQINNPFILALKAYNLTVEIHHHSAYQIVLSNDTPFTSTISGNLCERNHGFLLKPQVPHFCVAEKGSLNVLNIEPYSNIGLELLAKGSLIEEMSFPVKAGNLDYIKTIHENERDHIIEVLQRCKGRIWGPGAAAEVLKLAPSTLKSRMKKLGIKKKFTK